MPSTKRSNSSNKTEEEDENDDDNEGNSKTGELDSGAIAATFVFGAVAGAVALWLIETFDANERSKGKVNAERPS